MLSHQVAACVMDSGYDSHGLRWQRRALQWLPGNLPPPDRQAARIEIEPRSNRTSHTTTVAKPLWYNSLKSVGGVVAEGLAKECVFGKNSTDGGGTKGIPGMIKPRWELGALLTVACFSSAQQGTTSSDCSDSWISDGMCDSSNNNSNCDYDGGDCCSCDCFDDTYECGSVTAFTCIDPSSSCTYHHYYDDDGEEWAAFTPSPFYTVTLSPTAYPQYHFDDDSYDSPTYYDGFLDDDDTDFTPSPAVYVHSSDTDHDGDSFDSPTYSDGFLNDDDEDEADNDKATSDDGDDEAPVGAIVGGAVGGTAFLAAAAVLGYLFFTGRLKCSKCSSSSDPPAAPTPAGDGSTRAATKAYPAPVAAGGGVPGGPHTDLPPPPPAVLAPAGDRSAQSATATFPEPMASAATAPAAPASDLPPPPAYGSYDHDATTTAAPPPPYGHPVNQYPQPK
ncbi:unnamed protein product [Ectocarpus sp. CCAP 1310/34]|nr:unnamed protein product [Ectocarpus sp. CCAP 1310/34]